MHARARLGGAVGNKLLAFLASGVGLLLVAELCSGPLWPRLALCQEAEMGTVVFMPNRDLTRRFEEGRGLVGGGRYAEGVGFLGGILAGGEDYFFRPDPAQPVYRSLKSEARRVLAELPPAGRQAYELHYAAGAARQLAQAAQAGNQPALEEVARRWPLTPAGAQASLALGLRLAEQGRPEAAALAFGQVVASPVAPEPLVKLAGLYAAACRQTLGETAAAQAGLAALKARFPQSPPTVAGQARPWFASDSEALPWLSAALGPGWPRALGAESRERGAGSDDVATNDGATHEDTTNEDPTKGNAAATNADTTNGAASHDAGATPADWLLAGGNPARNAPAAGGPPLLSPRWRVRTSEHPTIERLVAGLRSAFADQQTAALPAGQPLALGDLVLLRTARKLVAVDFVTGKRIWEVAPWEDDAFERLLEAGRSQQRLQQAMNSSRLALVLEQRLWDDAAYGGLSSDGRNVYLLEELGFTSGLEGSPNVLLPGGQRRLEGSWPKTFNRLAARELKTEGKLLWEVGGETGEAEPALAGAFFLGAPLPLWDRLWALAELQGEIRLVELEAASGKQTWSQPLAVVERNIVEDSVRRLAGASPSYADGVLVCPTSAGAVVAVDLASRSLLWGYHYPRTRPAYRERLGAVRMGYAGGEPGVGSSFSDALLTVAEGRVLVAPPEADELHCLNLADGQLLWKQPRGENLYVATVREGRVVLVGRQQVSAWRLADGQPAWTTKLPTEALPTGRGYVSENTYHLPLSDGSLTPLDLATGQLGAPVRAPGGALLGNLICHRGQVLSQGVDWLESFYQREPLERQVEATLAQTPDDPWALARRGELRQAAGQDALAVEDFRRAYRGYLVAQTEAQRNLDAGGPRRPWQQAAAGVVQTRELLVAGLLAALGRDFVAHRDFVAEVEPLIERPEQRVALWRLTAAGWQRSGQIAAALEAYLALADLEPSPGLETVEPGHEVRRDRWINARLSELRAQADEPQRQQIDQAVAARLATAEQAATPEAYARFLELFGGQPAADGVRAALARLRQERGQRLEAEQLWRRLATQGPPEFEREAAAQLARLLDQAGRPDEAARQYRLLAERWPDEPCLDGQTGRQLAAALPPNSPTQARLKPHNWPPGQTQVKQGTPLTSAANLGYNRLPVALRAPNSTESPFDALELDTQQQDVVCRDGYGVERWRVSLNETAGDNPFAFQPQLCFGYPQGHLLVLSTGSKLFAVNTLGDAVGGRAQVLWRETLAQQASGLAYQTFGFQQRQLQNPWGRPWTVPTDQQDHLIGVAAALGESGVCFQRQRELVCVHPLTGAPQWVRKGLPPGSDLFGDEELLFVASEQSGKAIVLRAADGALLGERPLPANNKRWATLGRNVLTWRVRSGRLQLALVDVWGQRDLWAHSFGLHSKGALLNHEAVGVVDPQGTFTLLSLADGRELIQAEIDPEPQLAEAVVVASEDQYLVVTNRPATRVRRNREVQAIPPGGDTQLVSGHVYAFDRATGRKLWPVGAVVEQHGFDRNQPALLPFLVFARHIVEAQSGSGPYGRQPVGQTGVLCLDKRTGRALLKRDDLGQGIATYEVVADPGKNRVTLAFAQRPAMIFEFTDDPRPPEPPYQAGAEGTANRPNATAALSGVAGAVFRAFGGRTPGVSTPESDPPKPGQAAVAPADAADEPLEEPATDSLEEPADEPLEDADAPSTQPDQPDPPTPDPDDD
ncbi:MAG: PQQ-binding-like beta-propeller repeat protein [Pirellulales bacterium]